MKRLVGVPYPRQHIGNAIRMRHLSSLPAGLGYAGDYSLVRQLPETDAAQAELPEIAPGSTAPPTTIVVPGGVLRRTARLGDQGFFCHVIGTPLCEFSRKGMPISLRRALPSSSVSAVVATATSRPRTLLTLSYSISGKIICSRIPTL